MPHYADLNKIYCQEISFLSNSTKVLDCLYTWVLMYRLLTLDSFAVVKIFTVETLKFLIPDIAVKNNVF
jgi:hypothetical protein